jgi:hypothetical protein
VRVEKDSYGLGSKDRKTLLLLTYFGHQLTPGLPSDTELGYMSNPNVGEYEGRTGLSPPAAYPSTMGNEVNEGSRHHVYAINYYSSIDQGYPSLSGPSTRASITTTNDEPACKYE